MFPICYLHRLSCLFGIVTLGSSESVNSINAECGQNITLPCNATRDGEIYRYVIWYKIQWSQDMLNITRTGIIMKVNNVVKPFSGARVAMFVNGEGLLLQSIRPEDSGTYECHLSAYVGSSNKDSNLTLNVSECVIPATTPDVVTVTGVMSTSINPYMDQVVEVSMVLIVSGFSAVAVVKVVLSILSVGVLLMVRKREENRRLKFWK
ncbi:hypothetical protein AAFF_G00090780 [Aldrovandia affinis]|uniref:Ig-like domain-containing protein n=1 Tax=Aldrovandia affinis TaxID=143900 RepID=A0AAD7RVQ5_9TELE|nr:hypothetical protein AAFF_G00090780 [Aldrovandia affinis]